MRSTALSVLLIAVAAAQAQDAPSSLRLTTDDVSLYAPLDGDAAPLICRGDGGAAKVGTLEFAPGVRGQAFRFCDNDGFIDYATRSVLNGATGAISVWVCPAEWGEGDTHIRHFVTFPAGSGDKGWFCWLYKFFAGSCYFLVWEPDYRRPVLVAKSYKWPQGEWIHFVATWNGCRMRLFANGEEAGLTHTLRRTLLPTVGAALRLGGRSDPDRRATLLDEFYVFSRELTAAEAKALYEMDKAGAAASLPAHAQLELPEVAGSTLLGLRARQYPGEKKVVAGVDVLALSESERKAHVVSLAIRSGAGDVLQQGTAPLDRAYVEHAFSASGQEPGDYELEARLLRNGQVVEQTRTPFAVRPKPAWLGGTLGETQDVIEPWTPVKAGEGQAECWGRKVVWAGRLLPAQIVSQGVDVLAAPMRLTATLNGQAVAASDQSFAFVEKTPQRATFAGKARVGGLEVELDGWIEFDGMLWMTLRTSGAEGAQVDRFALEIPMRKQAATLMIAGRGTSPNTGFVRPFRTRMEGRATIWVGSEKAGLSWTCSEYRQWHCPAPDPRLEIETDDAQVLIRANFVSRTAKMDAPRAFTFGLIPTPVRPKTPGWRKWGFGTQPTDDPINIYTEGWARGHGSPIPGEKFEKWYAKSLKDGKKLFYYLTLSSNSPVTDAYGTFGDEWARSPLGNKPHDPNGPAGAHTGVCPGASSLNDWLLWAFKKHISDAGLPVTGIYVDVASTATCSNGYHGCGYVDANGARIATLPILGVRRWQKRLYTYLRARHPGAILMNHQSADINLYQLGFCDTMVDGENLTLLLQAKSYPELLPLDTWRAEYMGHPFGYIAVFLPEFTRAVAGDKQKKLEYLGDERIPEVEYLAGLGITHDNLIWPAYSNPRPYRAVQEAKKTFGWDDKVEFLPYWDNAAAVTLEANPNPERIVCSLYRRQGTLMAAVMNATPDEATVRVKPDYAALGLTRLAPLPWVDAYLLNTFEYLDFRHNHPRPKRTFEGKRLELPQKDGAATVTVKPNNFRLLLLREQPRP